MKNSRAFTLTEVLLVSAMFAVISLAVFNAFANGFKLWARGQHVMVEADVAIFLDRFAADLRQTAAISGIAFKGSSRQIAFPAIIRAPADPNGSRASEGITSQLGAVRYTFDPEHKKILRSQAVYGQAIKDFWSDPVPVADLIEDIEMRYYFSAEHGLESKEETDQALPMGVAIDVKYLVEGQEFHMRRFLVIPVGGGI